MRKSPLSPAAARLLRALVARAGIEEDKIFLTKFNSVDWHSLTFIGERHEIELRIPGPDADRPASRLANGLTEAEFSIPGQIVADIGMQSPPSQRGDGSITLSIEALTIVE